MKKYIFFFLISSFFYSCDDGDIIVDPGFVFNTTDLKLCNTGDPLVASSGNAVFFNINSTTNEAIAFELNNRFYSLTTASVENGEEIPVERTNFFYRKFDSRITDDYFCSGIPSSTNNIISELKGDRGTITINTVNVSKLDGDDDRDRISNEDEGFFADANRPAAVDGYISVGSDLTIFRDTDKDGIPDFRDLDDDNDNVRTSSELDENNMPSLDTDGDGVFNHLDNDDDGDMIPTRNEITEEAVLPTDSRNANTDELNFYLDINENTNNRPAESLLTNIHTELFRTSVVSEFVGLSDGNSTVTKSNLPFGILEDNEPSVETILDIEEIRALEMMPSETTP